MELCGPGLPRLGSPSQPYGRDPAQEPIKRWSFTHSCQLFFSFIFPLLMGRSRSSHLVNNHPPHLGTLAVKAFGIPP